LTRAKDCSLFVHKVKPTRLAKAGFFQHPAVPRGRVQSEASTIQTLGEACSQGWRLTVRCAYGRSGAPRSQSSRECNYRKELDMETLVWTRGRAFPLSRLECRLRCPRCGSRYVVVLYEPLRRAACGRSHGE
jgi:hypothetical protein